MVDRLLEVERVDLVSFERFFGNFFATNNDEGVTHSFLFSNILSSLSKKMKKIAFISICDEKLTLYGHCSVAYLFCTSILS